MAFSSIGISLGGDDGMRILVGPSDPLGWDHSGRDVFFLFMSAPLVLSLVILFDVVKSEPRFATLWPDPKVVDAPVDEDEDVIAERERVDAGNADDAAIRLAHLRKVYRSRGANKVAVRDLSFAIAKGECFGFLGINGMCSPLLG